MITGKIILPEPPDAVPAPLATADEVPSREFKRVPKEPLCPDVPPVASGNPLEIDDVLTKLLGDAKPPCVIPSRDACVTCRADTLLPPTNTGEFITWPDVGASDDVLIGVLSGVCVGVIIGGLSPATVPPSKNEPRSMGASVVEPRPPRPPRGYRFIFSL